MSARQRKRRETRRHDHSSVSRKRLVVAGGITAGAALAFSGAAQAATTYTVGTNADASSGGACTTPSNTDCSLREAISLANANSGADTIVFNSNLTGQTITLATGELPIDEALTITGPGASDLSIDGDSAQRIFNVNPATADDPVSISGVTMANGDAGNASGGAVYNDDADLTLTDVLISDSYATNIPNHGLGGGVYTNTGPLNINSSTLAGNHAFYGGAVGSYYGAVSITDSTLSGNYADGNTGSGGDRGYGGAINIQGADLTVTGSTIYDNTAAYDGGGIYSASAGDGGSVRVVNSTIADNHAANDDGGGVWICCGGSGEPGDALTVIDSTVTGNTAATNTGGLESYMAGISPVLENSIVSGNTSGTAPGADDLYSYSSGPWKAAFDLIGVPSGYVTSTVPSSNLFSVDPQLGALQDNGGPTETMLPAATSPAIDCGSDPTRTFDQRGAGFPRVVDQPNRTNSTASGANGADMGAVEVAANAAIGGACTNSPPPSPTPTPSPTPAPHKKKCKKKKKHKRSAESSKKKCKKKKKH